MTSTYIEFIGTVIAISNKNNKTLVQLLMGEPTDVINDTQNLSSKDMLSIEINEDSHPKLGDRMRIQGQVTITKDHTLKMESSSNISKRSDKREMG